MLCPALFSNNRRYMKSRLIALCYPFQIYSPLFFVVEAVHDNTPMISVRHDQNLFVIIIIILIVIIIISSTMDNN